MQIRFKVTLPDALEPLAKSKPGELAQAIEKTIIKTLCRDVRASARIAFEGEDYDGELEDDNNKD